MFSVTRTDDFAAGCDRDVVLTVLESQNHVSAKGSRSPPFLKNRLLINGVS